MPFRKVVVGSPLNPGEFCVLRAPPSGLPFLSWMLADFFVLLVAVLSYPLAFLDEISPPILVVSLIFPFRRFR